MSDNQHRAPEPKPSHRACYVVAGGCLQQSARPRALGCGNDTTAFAPVRATAASPTVTSCRPPEPESCAADPLRHRSCHPAVALRVVRLCARTGVVPLGSYGGRASQPRRRCSACPCHAGSCREWPRSHTTVHGGSDHEGVGSSPTAHGLVAHSWHHSRRELFSLRLVARGSYRLHKGLPSTADCVERLEHSEPQPRQFPGRRRPGPCASWDHLQSGRSAQTCCS